jgi:hypothetical protein
MPKPTVKQMDTCPNGDRDVCWLVYCVKLVGWPNTTNRIVNAMVSAKNRIMESRCPKKRVMGVLPRCWPMVMSVIFRPLFDIFAHNNAIWSKILRFLPNLTFLFYIIVVSLHPN